VGAANLLDRYAWEHGGKSWTGHDLALDDGNTSHARVGSFAPNPFGLHDVIGNVAEWCRDGLDPDSYRRAAHTDPCSDPAKWPLRFTRGGSFGLPLFQARASPRWQGPAETAELFNGLRPARALDGR
jgi:formylglycine-generating enzyme required for sulfatase activity